MGAPEQTRIAKALLEIRPQARQEQFLSSVADIAIFGGGAYGGKTFALLMDPLRWKALPGISATFFRRTMKQADNPGGLWDESCALYAPFGCTSFVGPHEHRFTGGMTVTLAGMELETDRFNWDGAQIPVICWDQLEHFEAIQFWYMLSRNRDPSGRVRPYMRATCNPDPDSWVAEFIAWWIDPATGYAIPERAGVLRWFVRLSNDSLAWGDSREELMARGLGDPALPLGHPEQPWMSATFIYSTIYDNPIGMERDPTYLVKLKSEARVERERLLGDPQLGGNWKIRAAAGLMFRREWCRALPAEPAGLERVVRGWDLAGTLKTDANDPSWTFGVKLGRYERANPLAAARFVILDARCGRLAPSGVRGMVKGTAAADGSEVRVSLPQDPGQAGKDQVAEFVGMLAGYDVRTSPETGDKVTRFNPFSAQAEVGNVDYVAGSWNDEFFRQLEGFPDARHDDGPDAVSRAFRELCEFSGPVIVIGATEVVGGLAGDEEDGVMVGDAPWAGLR